MESESDGRPPASRLDGATMDVYRCCRFKRKAFVVTVMVCGCMCFALYTLSFSCCAVVIAGVENTGNSRGSNVVLLDSVRSARYERSYADSQKTENRFVRKTLAQDKSEDTINGERTGESRDNYKMGVHNHYSASSEGNKDTNKDLRYNGDERAAQSDIGGEQGHLDTSDNVYAQTALRGTRTSEEVDANGMKNVPVSGIVRVHKRGSRKLPQAIIIGVKKGGTRALLEFIRMHPDVRAPGPETHFFDRHYHRGMEWYRNQMPPTIEGQITMEKTPSYFVTREVPRRIYNMSKDMKLLVVVRDPVTRAISDYTQTLTKRPGVLKPFEEMAFLNNSTGLVDTSWGAIRIGVYAKHLERWLKYFPLSQIHFVSGERLITDPATELAKVQDFLGLKRVITEKHFYFNETKGFPCLKKPEGSSNPHCLGKTKGRRHPQIDPKVLQRLRLFFRPFNAKFYQMTNQNFGWD